MIIFKLSFLLVCIGARKLRSVDRYEPDSKAHINSVEYIWASTTVAVGDTAVLHCSFDAIFQQLRNGNIDWYREVAKRTGGQGVDNKLPQIAALSQDGATAGLMMSQTAGGIDEWEIKGATPIASGKKLIIEDNRFRVYRPHNSALSVLIIRRAKKKDAGIYRCNLSSSSTRHRYLILNVTESKIEAQTSAATMRVKLQSEAWLWCNATGYPKPVVYWTREDSTRKLPDGSYQYWGNGLQIVEATELDTGIYACFLDNYVQPIVSYKFSVIVEDNPWVLDGYKMRYDSKQWNSHDSVEPKPVRTKSFLLMCETKGASKPLPIIRWYRDGKAVRNNKHFYIIEDAPESKLNYASSTLIIMNFLPRYHGNYTCVASNVFRMKKLTFYITDYLESELDELPPLMQFPATNRMPAAAKQLKSNKQATTPQQIDTQQKSPSRMNVKEIFIRHQKISYESSKMRRNGLTTFSPTRITEASANAISPYTPTQYLSQKRAGSQTQSLLNVSRDLDKLANLTEAKKQDQYKDLEDNEEEEIVDSSGLKSHN